MVILLGWVKRLQRILKTEKTISTHPEANGNLRDPERSRHEKMPPTILENRFSDRKALPGVTFLRLTA